jgi:hypothetical protein
MASHVNPVEVIRWLSSAADSARPCSHMPLVKVMHMSVVTRRAWEGGRIRSDSSQLCNGTTRCKCHNAAMSLLCGRLGWSVCGLGRRASAPLHTRFTSVYTLARSKTSCETRVSSLSRPP